MMAIAATSKNNIGVKSSMETNSKTRPNAESFNANWNTGESASEPRNGSGMRRRRSFNDNVHAMYKRTIGKGVEQEGKSSDKSSSDMLSRAATVAGRKQRAPKRHSDPTGNLSASRSAGINRRRSRRSSQTETVMHYSNDAISDRGKRRDMFRSDFPGEPIPSDAILMRLYGNMPLAPPPPSPAKPHPYAVDEQASTSNGSYSSTASPSTSRSSKNPLISPELSESSKSKVSLSSTRRSSSKSKLLDAGGRSRSHSQPQHSRNNKTRRSSKANDLASDTKGSKNKGNKRRDGLSNSSHHKRDSSQKSKSTKSSETMKIRSKYDPKFSPSEGSRSSDYEAFQALLDLSNGSFFDDDELNADESMNFMRTSLASINSAPLGFVEGQETGDRERKKKRKGKRGDAKIRSRSVDENRDSSTKSRRGKRSSKSKSSSTGHDRKSLHSSFYDESGGFSMDSSLRGEQSERVTKTYKSPKAVTRKKSINADGLKPGTSPKILNIKAPEIGSPGSLSTRKQIKKRASSKTGLTALTALKPQAKVEKGSMNSKSPNRDDSTKTNGVTAKEIIATARDILASPKLIGNETEKSRWKTQQSPANNARLPRSENSSINISNIDQSVPPPPLPPESTTPPESPKKLDFHLNFLEYQNVSPLTIASRKIIASDVIGAIDLLED